MNVALNYLITEQFTRSLEALNNILIKAEDHAKERGFDPNAFLELRLAPDMFKFSRQVQIVTDLAKGAIARLTNNPAPTFEDKDTTIQELKTRIGKTIEYIATAKPEDFNGYESKVASFPWYPGKGLEGRDYLVSHAIPNFYFHISMTYALLRQHGVKLGKADFLGNQNWKNV